MIFKNVVAKLRSVRRFSLRTGLIAFLAIGVALGVIGSWVHNIRRRGDATRWIIDHSDFSSSKWSPTHLYSLPLVDKEPSQTTSLIRKWVHPEYQIEFDMISAGGDLTHEDIANRIQRVFGVKRLFITEPVSAAGLNKLLATPHLKEVYLRGPIRFDSNRAQGIFRSPSASIELLEIHGDFPLPEALANQICTLPRLTTITISPDASSNVAYLSKSPFVEQFVVDRRPTAVTYLPNGVFIPTSRLEIPDAKPEPAVLRAALDVMFQELAQRQKLKRLDLRGLWLDEQAAMTAFCERSRIESLHLPNSHLSSERLRDVAKLKKLKCLEISTRMLTDDEQFQTLLTMTDLTELWLVGRIEASKIRELEQRLPGCKIHNRSFSDGAFTHLLKIDPTN